MEDTRRRPPSKHRLAPLDDAGFLRAYSKGGMRISKMLSQLWADKAIAVDAEGRVAVDRHGDGSDPHALIHKARRTARVLLHEGCFLLAPGHTTKLGAWTDIGVAVGYQRDGGWFLHPSVFLTGSISQRTAAQIPTALAAHPPTPAAAGRLDPRRPLWSLPLEPSQADALPAGVHATLSSLLLGALVECTCAESTPNHTWTGDLHAFFSNDAYRFGVGAYITGQNHTIALGRAQETRLWLVIQRMMDAGELPPRLATCHPSPAYEMFCRRSMDGASAHERMRALAFFQARCKAMDVPDLGHAVPVPA